MNKYASLMMKVADKLPEWPRYDQLREELAAAVTEIEAVEPIGKVGWDFPTFSEKVKRGDLVYLHPTPTEIEAEKPVYQIQKKSASFIYEWEECSKERYDEIISDEYAQNSYKVRVAYPTLLKPTKKVNSEDTVSMPRHVFEILMEGRRLDSDIQKLVDENFWDLVDEQ